MASSQCAAVGLMIALFAAVGISFTLISRYWQISSQASSQQVNQGISSYAGLWVRCTSYTKGQFQCDKYDESYLGLPASLNTQRAFMVIAVILIYPGMICGLLSMRSVNVLDDKSKMYSGRAGGGMIMAAGVLTLIACSWYGANVVQQFYEDQLNDNAFTYQFGSALYIGWITGGLAVVAGFLMLCCTESAEEDEYSYNPPTKHTYGGGSRRQNDEYV